MTADLVQNGPQPGGNPPFPSQVRAIYDQDMPLAALAFDRNKGDLNLGAGKVAFPGGMKEKGRVHSQDETENRKSSLLSGSPARWIKSKDGVQEGAPGHLLMQDGESEQRENPTMSYLRKIQVQDPSEIGKPQRRDKDEKLEGTDEAEAKPSIGFKSQATTAAPQGPQLQQPQYSQQQYPQQGVSGGWENFLPQRNLRILLVEDDDSTRHVVGALLRNCGYEVTMAATGVQAWELLPDKNSHFDLVLTEVMLPGLSGISLLAKIMNHESCKHIPVVMMSSLDTVDVVFKCLSKGAVDFLVKPVRKNELKNLWQHVWRKCHSSSGSGSGSGSQTGKVGGLKDMNGIGNNSDSESSSLNVGGGSDNGSGTQSFWTKRREEVESPERPSEWDSTRRPHGALTPADTQTNAGVLPKDRKKSSLDAPRGQAHFQANVPVLPDHVLGKNLETAAPRAGALEFQVAKGDPLQEANQTVQKVLPMQDVEQRDSLDDEGMADGVGGALRFGTKVIDLLGNIACQLKSKENHHSSKDGEMLDRGASNSPKAKDNISGSISLPTLELTLKRSHTTDEEDRKVDDRHVLRQSGASAFSRYSNSGAILHQHPHFPVGSYTLNTFPLQGGYVGHTTTAVTGMGANHIGGLRTASPADKAGPFKGSEVSAPLPSHAQVSCGGNNQDTTPVAGSSRQEVFAQPAEEDGASASGMPISIAVPSPAMLSFNGVGAFGPSRNQLFYTNSSNSPWAAATHLPEQGEGYTQQQFDDHGLPHQSHQQTYHHHSHHYHHHHVQHHYHHHRARAKLESTDSVEEEQTVTNAGTGAPRCGSSNLMGHVPGNLGQSGSSNGYGANGNGNGSVSGSNNGSNNHNGNSNGQSGIMANAGGNGDSGNNNGNSGSGNGHGISSVNGGNGSGVVVGPEQNSFTRREAALNKFRQKRKERCFEKKVRYQSRKKLAEQRPRVRGQFVRQAIMVPANTDKGHGNCEYTLADLDGDIREAERN